MRNPSNRYKRKVIRHSLSFGEFILETLMVIAFIVNELHTFTRASSLSKNNWTHVKIFTY